LAQLNRDCDSRADRRPLLSDLRESGAIEQDADVVVMLYRDEVYSKDSQYKGTAELLVRKNRHGATGDIFTSFNKETMRFYDIAHEWEKPLNVTPIKANRGFN
jgi:replicative DNA helicase